MPARQCTSILIQRQNRVRSAHCGDAQVAALYRSAVGQDDCGCERVTTAVTREACQVQRRRFLQQLPSFCLQAERTTCRVSLNGANDWHADMNGVRCKRGCDLHEDFGGAATDCCWSEAHGNLQRGASGNGCTQGGVDAEGNAARLLARLHAHAHIDGFAERVDESNTLLTALANKR